MNDLISIIVPVYNVEQYLEECADSLLAQTYSPIEIILVDDGSADSSGRICDMYAQKYDSVRVIHQANGGLSAARNTGIASARGSYITFVDSDDRLDPGALARMHRACMENSAQICACSFLYFEKFGEKYAPGGGLPGHPLPDAVLTPADALRAIYTPYGAPMVTACNKLFDARLFEGFAFPVGRLHEDSFTIHTLLGKCSHIVTLSDKLYLYRQRPGSITHASAVKVGALDAVEALYARYVYLKERGDVNDLLPVSGKMLSYRYAKLIASFKPGNDTEKARVREIRTLADEFYRSGHDLLDAKDRLALRCPRLFTLLFKMKTGQTS